MNMPRPSSPIGDYIVCARKRAKLTQTQLGDILGVTKGNVSSWENANHLPSIPQLRRISEVTGEPIPRAVVGNLVEGANQHSQLLDRYARADLATRTLIDLALADPGGPMPEGISPSLRVLVDMARTAIRNEQQREDGKPIRDNPGT